MSFNNKHSHLTLDERIIIEKAIANNSKKMDIASTLGKDKSTIGKEIRRHRILSHHNSYPTDCSSFQKCKKNITVNLVYAKTISSFHALEEIVLLVHAMVAKNINTVATISIVI